MDVIISNLKAIIATVFFVTSPEIPQNVDCDKIRANNEVTCLACNMYHEARGETHEGRVAVAMVTRNRVDSDRFPDTFCNVVWQRRQFSWSHDGKSDRVRNAKVWEETYLTAYIVVNSYRGGRMYFNDITHGSLWYHADWTNPNWSLTVQPVAIIGRHRFYTHFSTMDEVNNIAAVANSR